MSGSSGRVIKLGGSLLEWADWRDAFRRWFALQPPLPSVLIVGGGALADAVRRLDRIHQLDPSDSHWLAIGAMSLTAQLVQRLLPEAAWTDDAEAVLRFCDEPLLTIFDPSRFLEAVEPMADGEPLSHSWNVTSDSIAARIAELLGYAELVLLKSRLPAGEMIALQGVADDQFVDRCFPRYAEQLAEVRLINLRDTEFSEIRIRPGG